jgi:glycosyltransferase involved in cell wall biosynthesis
LSAANNKLGYFRELVRLMSTRRRFDVVICSHINLLAPATIAKLRFGAPMIAFIYGIDAWTRLPLERRAFLPWVDRFVSISETTRANFQAWSNVRKRKITLLPNAIHAEWYGMRPKNPDLIRRYGIENKRILMTLGRLVSSERYKGFDEVLDIIPDLVAEFPDLLYMIVGDGSDKGRLEQRVADMGLGDYVRFTGRISENEKADHFRLADAYVMPSRGEGFGFVLLEAMACGVPVVASALDGGREAILDGAMGTLVDPDDPQDIRRGIVAALNAARGSVPPRLAEFSYENFSRRAKIIVDEVVLHS